MSKNDIRVGEETAAAVTAAIFSYLGHGDFVVRSIKPSASESGKKSPVSKKSQFVSWKIN